MDMITLAMRLGSDATTREAGSALPNAPVVLDQEGRRWPSRPIAIGPRVALARGLERAAQAISPPAAQCRPTH